MRTAIFIADGREQLVLTPETDLEKLVLAKIENGHRTKTICKGSFYRSRGGWTRQGQDDASTIFVMDEPDAGVPPHPTTEPGGG